MKLNDLRVAVKFFGGWSIRTDGESCGEEHDSRWRTVYIASKTFEDGPQVRLRSHLAGDVYAFVVALETRR